MNQENNQDRLLASYRKVLDNYKIQFKNCIGNREVKYNIKRLITFIQTELPENQKYESIIILLKSLIYEKKRFVLPSRRTTVKNINRVITDIQNVLSFDSIASYGFMLHPKVVEVASKLFLNNHYSQAIFESVKALNNYVKFKANIMEKDLANAMAKAFDENSPLIKLNDLKTQSDIDEHRGFKLLFMGAMTGIRNPIGHDNYEFDRNTTLYYLAFLSLLFKKAEDGSL